MANTQPFSDPVGISKLTAQAIGLEAIDHRRGQGGLSAPSTGSTSGTLSGVFPGGTAAAGVSNDLQGFVSSGLTVTHNAGHYACDRGGGSLYLGMAYNSIAVTLEQGDANNPRIDLLVIRNWDPGVDGSAITETAKIVYIKGTPAATPTAPTGSVTSRDVVLTAATVGYGANASTIMSLEDKRLFVVARGGITPRPSWDSRPGSYEGQYRDNLETNTFERWSGTAWEAVASPAAWTSFTPKLFSAAGECNLGSAAAGAKAQGAYQVIGKNLRVRYLFEAKRPCNLGYGQIYTLLPAGLVSATAAGDFHGRAQLNTQPPGGAYLTWIGDAGMFGNSNRVFPIFNKTITDNTFAPYQVAQSAGQAGTGIPLLAGEYPDPLRGLGMSIELEIQ